MIILKGIEAKISDKILNAMYGAIWIDDETSNRHYHLQWKSELYTLQKDKFVRGCKWPIKAYIGEIVRDAIFQILNLI